MQVFTFTRMYPGLIPPMRGDKAAMGSIPTSAFQYCEAMRVASSHGWYVFPPADLALRFNGIDIFVEDEPGTWEPLTVRHLPRHREQWDESCPSEYKGLTPPYLRALPAVGAIQIWSGWLIEATEGWGALVRPLVNAPRTHLYQPYEGYIEVDSFRPCPLFVNLQLRATDTTIRMSRVDPIFQVQEVLRESYTPNTAEFREGLGESSQMSEEDWASFRLTVRTGRPDDQHRLGDYAADVRKRAKASARECPFSATHRSQSSLATAD